MTQKACGHQSKRRNHGNLVDLLNNFIPYFPIKALALVQRHLFHGLVLSFKVVLHDNGLTDIDINPPIPFAQYFGTFDDFRRALLGLWLTGQLVKVSPFLDHPVIADIHRDGSQILTILFLIGLKDHRQQSVFGHDHFPGPASAAFNEEFQRQPFLEQDGKIGCKNFTVEFVATKTAAQEKSTGTAKDITHGKKRHVIASRDKRHLDFVLEEYV